MAWPICRPGSPGIQWACAGAHLQAYWRRHISGIARRLASTRYCLTSRRSSLRKELIRFFSSGQLNVPRTPRTRSCRCSKTRYTPTARISSRRHDVSRGSVRYRRSAPRAVSFSQRLRRGARVKASRWKSVCRGKMLRFGASRLWQQGSVWQPRYDTTFGKHARWTTWMVAEKSPQFSSEKNHATVSRVGPMNRGNGTGRAEGRKTLPPFLCNPNEGMPQGW